MKKIKKTPKVAIMMATYNGEKYLAKQLESILEQTYFNWELFVSDDGSKDETMRILEKYKNKDSRIKRIDVNSGKHGPFMNFYNVMRNIKNDKGNKFEYFFYCDQDDIWINNKIEYEVRKIQEAENLYPNDPILCYSDLLLMNSDGNMSNERLSDFTHIKLENTKNIYFSHRYVWGTTMAHNRMLWDLLNINIDIPQYISHDNYIGKYAAAYGRIIYIDKPLVKYRRHGENVSGVPHSYNIVSGLYRGITQVSNILDNHARTYKATLFFINNAPKLTPFLIELKYCLENGGWISRKFIKEYKICTSKNIFNKIAFKLIIYTGIYKTRNIFKEG